MARRTTLFLDEDTREAARQLAGRYDCTMSEAIRRAVQRQRDAVLGVPPESRDTRLRSLKRLYVLFEGHDAAVEVARLKTEDEGF